jgi:hypothetical protein
MKSTTQRIEIPLSKQKLVLMLSGSIAFVAIGLWFVIAPPAIENVYWGNPAKITIAGYAAILFFGLCSLLLIRKLQDNKPGLIFDDSGLTDNSSGISAGKILWSDIENISVIEIQRQKLVKIQVKNPQEYINKQTSVLKRKLMEMSNNMYGTPFSISANGLNISFDELLKMLTDELNASRQ